MKTFNLQEALAGKPVVTRDGRKVTQLHLFECDAKFPLFVVIGGIGGITAFRKDGSWSGFSNTDAGADLFMAPVEKTVWVNLYNDWAGRYDSQEKADAWANNSPVTPRIGGKSFPITYEE